MSKKLPKTVKINYCSITDLLELKGIGRQSAESIIKYRLKHGHFITMEDLGRVPGLKPSTAANILDKIDWSFNGHSIPPPKIIKSDARQLTGIPSNSVDIIITSPPYWKKRDYKHAKQIGQEETPAQYINTLTKTIDSWISLLRPHASVFINIGDTYRNGELVGIPDLLSVELRKHNWLIVNKIIWAKSNGVPERLPYRLANRHEVILQLTRNRNFYSDVNALAQFLKQSSNPGDVWSLPHNRNTSKHLAPFPEQLVKRIIEFSCPEHICSQCGAPYLRHWRSSSQLDINRPQARRAMELFREAGLTEAHLKAIRAVGISDAGKGKRVQTGSDGNAKRTQTLAKEAKKILGGYFREFTFAPKKRTDWIVCNCHAPSLPGTVLDPYLGSGTTVRVANQMGRIAIGSDLIIKKTSSPKLKHGKEK
jgi:competence ComEA-like helix-hairpin-helix protein